MNVGCNRFDVRGSEVKLTLLRTFSLPSPICFKNNVTFKKKKKKKMFHIRCDVDFWTFGRLKRADV